MDKHRTMVNLKAIPLRERKQTQQNAYTTSL